MRPKSRPRAGRTLPATALVALASVAALGAAIVWQKGPLIARDSGERSRRAEPAAAKEPSAAGTAPADAAPAQAAPSNADAARPLVRAGAPAIDGEMDPFVVARVVRGQQAALEDCYASAVAQGPAPSGKLVLHWVIGKEGRPRNAELEADTVGSGRLAACVVSVIGRAVFPASGGETEVSHPFLFGPAPSRGGAR